MAIPVFYNKYINNMYGPPLAYSAGELRRLKFYTLPKSRKLRETIARLARELEGFVCSDETLKTKQAFREADHPRREDGKFAGKDGAAVMSGAKPNDDRQKPRAIPEELFSEDTVIIKKPPAAPVIEKIFSITQEKPAAIGRALQAANPNFGKPYTSSKASYKKNCQNCAVAYELQRRGYKVTAMPHSGKAADGEISNALQAFDIKEYQRAARGRTDLENELKKQTYPEGSRFIISQELSVEKEKSWHNYTAEKINGEIKYFDPQEGNSDASSILKQIRIRAGKYQLYFSRVDDKPLKEDVDFTKAVKPADKKEPVDKISG